MAGLSRRRWLWAAAGALLVASGAGAGLWFSTHGAEPVPVVVAGRDLPAGTVLADEDVRIVHASGADALEVLDARATLVVGQRVSVPVVEGAPLTADMLTATVSFPAPGEAVVSAALAPGVLPDSAVPGAPVAVIITGDGTAPSPVEEPADSSDTDVAEEPEDSDAATGAAVAGPRAVEARVHTVRAPADGAETETVVELVVAADEAGVVAEAASADRIRVALVADQDGGGVMLVSVCSLGGAPGATTVAMALAASWPDPDAAPLLVEADVGGGDIASWRRMPTDPGLSSLAARTRVRTGFSPPAEALNRHAQTLAGGLGVVLAPVDPLAAHKAAALVAEHPDVLREPRTVTVVDVGRMVPGSPGARLAAHTDAIVLVVRADVAQLRRLRECAPVLRTLPERGARIGLAVVGPGFSTAEVREQTGFDVWARLPHDVRSAGFLRGDTGAVRAWRRPLLRGARELAARVGREFAAHQQTLRSLVAAAPNGGVR